MSQENAQSLATLFVRNLPFQTTDEKLEEVFSDYGPVKRCFVVKEKGFDTCRGFGYVTFALKEDAQTAAKKIVTIDGRKLKVAIAQKKLNPKKKKKKDGRGGGEDDNKEEEQITKAEDVKLKENTQKPQKQQHKSSTVVISQLPKDLVKDDLHDKVKTMSRFVEIQSISDTGTALVKFRDEKSAVKALIRINNMEIKGKKCKAKLLSQDEQPLKAVKRARIIIRNLSFQSSKTDIENALKEFGEINEITIPTMKNGYKKGFAFVQFISLKSAGSAIQQMNGKLINGRPVAVDWAVSKDKFETAQTSHTTTEENDTIETKSKPQKPKQQIKVNIDSSSSDDDTSDEKDDNDDDEDSSESDEESQPKIKPTKAKPDSSSDESSIEEDDDSEDESSDADDDDESEDDHDDDDESEDDDDDKSDDTDEGFSDDSQADKKGKKSKKDVPKPQRKSDVGEGRTLFIRNLSFDSEEEDVGELMEEYGELVYCRLVVDKHTDHSKGTAFVQFKNKEDADKCLQAASEEGEGIVLDGRRLNISVAIDRSKAVELNNAKKVKESKDKRNLHLAREGMIRPGTQDAQGLTKADLDKRMKIEKLKKQKLRLPHIFISATRICIHNLPTSVDDKKLRGICLQAAGEKAARITECRVMRDMKRVNSRGVGKAMGFAFVDYTQHEHALQALRKLNNNPDIFGDNKRPIVEFSLENKIALNAKQKRLERVQLKQESAKRKQLSTNADSQPIKRQKSSVQSKHITIVAPATGADGKKLPKGLPSHWGPKIRHKKRDSANKGKQMKGHQNKSQRPAENMTPEGSTSPKTAKKKKKQKPKKKGQRHNQSDDFDKLVHRYKSQIMNASSRASSSSSASARPASKWFSAS